MVPRNNRFFFHQPQEGNQLGYVEYLVKEDTAYVQERSNRPTPMTCRVTLKARAAPASKSVHSKFVQPICPRFHGAVLSPLGAAPDLLSVHFRKHTATGSRTKVVHVKQVTL